VRGAQAPHPQARTFPPSSASGLFSDAAERNRDVLSPVVRPNVRPWVEGNRADALKIPVCCAGYQPIDQKNTAGKPVFQVLPEPLFELEAALAFGKQLDSLLDFGQGDDAYMLRLAIGRLQPTPDAGVGSPGRLYSDRTFVSIRKPLIQDQLDADSPWRAPDRLAAAEGELRRMSERLSKRLPVGRSCPAPRESASSSTRRAYPAAETPSA